MHDMRKHNFDAWYEKHAFYHPLKFLQLIQSMPITSVRRSWPMQIVKGSLYVMIELLKMTEVS